MVGGTNFKRVRRGDEIKPGENKTELLLGKPKARKKKLDPPLRLPRVVLESLRRHQAKQAEEQRVCGSAWRGDGKFTTRFGTPLEHIDREFHALCDTACLRRIRFHHLRHSAALILIAQGVHPKAIQELLRHSSIQLTMDLYGHLFEQAQRETADKMDAALGWEPAPVAVKIAVKPSDCRPS
jgi:integrase